MSLLQTSLFPVMSYLYSIMEKLVPAKIVLGLLFDEEITAKNRTKLAVEKLIERYASSIKAVNRAFAANILFIVLAVYPFIAGLADNSAITLPLVNVTVSVSTWLKVCPLISYGMQVYLAAMVIWFLLLRRALDLLNAEMKDEEYVGDVGNILLDGFIGVLWLL